MINNARNVLNTKKRWVAKAAAKKSHRPCTLPRIPWFCSPSGAENLPLVVPCHGSIGLEHARLLSSTGLVAHRHYWARSNATGVNPTKCLETSNAVRSRERPFH